MRRKLIYALGAMSGVLITAILVTFLLLATEAGSRWLIHRGANRAPSRLTINRIQGSILTGLNLYGIEYSTDKQHTRIEHVELSWQPMALLGGRVHLQSLYIQGVSYAAPVAKKTSAKETMRIPPDISFPLAVVVEDAKLEQLVFHRGNTQHTLDKVRLAGRLDRDGLWLKHFEAEGERVYINLKGHVKLIQPYPFQVKLNWSAKAKDSVKARGVGDFKGNINAIEFIHKLTEPYSLATQGELKLGSILPKSDSTSEQQKAPRPLLAEAGYRSRMGQHYMMNKNDSYQLSLRSDFTGQNLPLAHIQALGRGNATNFKVEKLVARTLGGMVEVSGHIAWQPEFRWDFTVNATNIDPGMQWPEWPGRLTLNAKLRGAIEAGIPTVLLHELSMVGHLLEQPFQMAGDLTIQGGQLEFENLGIRSGQNELIAEGTVGTHLDLMLEVDLPDPGSLWTGFGGRFRGTGSLRGLRTRPIGTIALKGHNVSYGYYTVQSLDAHLEYDLKNTQHSNVRVKLHNLLVREEVFPSLSLNWVGDDKNLRVHAGFGSASAKAEVEFVGGRHEDFWKLKVDKASFDPKHYGIWRLRNPVSLLVSHTEVKPFKACWAQEKSSLCLNGSWSETSGWKQEGDGNAPPLRCMIDLLKKLFKKENLGWGKDT